MAWVRDEIGTEDLTNRVAVLHCVSAYPTPIDQANVLSVPYLRERYGLVTGYSNHVIGPEAVLASVALGAQLIEVHFTDKKTGRTFRDHELSFEPDDLRNLIEGIKRVRQCLGTQEKNPMPCEAENRNEMRKGVVAARDIAAGTTLQREDLMYARPGTEIPAAKLENQLGRKLTRSLRRGELLTRTDVDLA